MNTSGPEIWIWQCVLVTSMSFGQIWTSNALRLGMDVSGPHSFQHSPGPTGFLHARAMNISIPAVEQVSHRGTPGRQLPNQITCISIRDWRVRWPHDLLSKPNQFWGWKERHNYYVWITGFNQDVYRHSTDKGRSACNKKYQLTFPKMQT